MEFETAVLDRLVSVLRKADWSAVVGVLEELVGPVSSVLLYGSRARGQEHAESDYDLLVVAAAAGEGIRFVYGGLDLDIEVCSAAVYEEALEGRLYLDCGRVLLDRGGFLGEWLARLRARRAQGPVALSEAQRLRMAGWLDRMLRRARAGGTVGALRGAALASSLPEAAVDCLGSWPGSPLQNLEVLRARWPELHGLLERWAEEGGLEHLESAVRLVAGAYTAGPKGSARDDL
ncbi:MAG: nucleotidyltransferase domain-containing protein [Candidatus Eremiobacteraeota bacterium]|nr:nucleotidyltransferase domain-containing protein [Candidatus Eremiobacteraeota bacterium]